MKRVILGVLGLLFLGALASSLVGCNTPPSPADPGPRKVSEESVLLPPCN